MSYIRPNSIYEPSYPAAHNKAYTDDPLDPVYHYTTYMGDIDSRSFSSTYIKPRNELPKYKYKKPSKNRRKQVAIASILFMLFFLAIVATCILFIYFLVNEDKVIETKAPPLAGGILIDAELSLEQQFLVQYDDPTTQEYQDLENEFKKAMDEIMLASNYSSTYAGTTVLDFRNGSTIVGFNLNFNDIPTHLDNEVGSKEFSDEIQQDIAGVINNAHQNSTLISDLNAKEDSLVVNDVREVDLPIVTTTTSKPIANQPSSTTQRPASQTTTTDEPSESTITIPETYSTTKTQEATTKSETTSIGPEMTTLIEVIETTESAVQLTTNELTSMQRITTKSSDAQTTDIYTTILKESTTEQLIDQTTLQEQTTVESTTVFNVDTTIATTLQTTEKSTTELPTTPPESTTDHLSTKVTTEQLTTEVPEEQLTTLLTTEQYTTPSVTTEQDTSPLALLTEFPANSSASIHVFGSMVLNESYPETLNNNSSNDYKDLVKALRIGIDCSVMHTELEAVYAGNDITEFKPGSIIIMFTIYLTSVPAGYYNESNRLSTSEYISSTVQYVLTKGIARGIFGNLEIIEDSATVIQVTNSVVDTPVCQDITSTCCRNLPYNTAVFPNSFAESQTEAEDIMNTFGESCRTDSALYLCSKVYPACPSNVTSQLLPCRSFCEDVVAEDGQSLLDAVTDLQVTNCTYLKEPSQDKPCFSSDGQVLTRPSAAYNEEICSIRPLYPPPSARIVGGQDASSGEWPWMISLQRFTSHQCGAVLIAPQYALTAAHCLGLFNILEFGTISLSSSTSPGEQRIGIETTYAHPEYDPLTLQNDIAIIKLEKQVDYTDYVRPICISTNASQFQAGENCYIAGWGDTAGNGKLPDILQEVSVPLVDLNSCAARYASIGISVDESVVCAGYPEGGKDSCQGDSGGPLVCRNSDGLWYLFGLVSNGIECALPNSPGVYTRVPVYMDFINLVLGGGTPLYRACTDEEFKCSNGPCINKDWQCDGHNDCRDNSDELMCGCSDDEFTCNMGDCVYDAWVCDGDYDCLDGSDEQNCGCLSNQFDCGDGVCIVLSYLCDELNDCRNGADEASCTTDGPAVCSDNEFMCGDGVCITGSYQCDDEFDCMDGSDEENCQEPTEPPVLPAQCYNVTSVICGDILISNQAIFPNAFARTPEDAEELMERFYEESDCHQDSIRLVCSFVYQGCEGNDQAPVHPCDSMCQSVIGTCAEAFQAVTRENNLFEISCSSLPDTHCLAAPGYCDGFLCNNNHCIEESYRCDNFIDCYDESDEAISSCDMTESPSYLCYPLNVTSCSNYLPYTYAAFPNDYAQTVEIADQAIKRLIGNGDCHDDMFLLMCNMLFPECDGYQYEPCKEHCVDVTESCQSQFLMLRNELNYTSPITCDDLPETNCLSSDGLCSDGDYQCDDGKCIPFDLTCDSHGDCLDYSDESNCSCTDEQYICSDTGSCLASYQVCDGFDNCPNGEDEIPCDNGCPGDFFRCANETSCIPLVYVCDGVEDCEQLNDEEGCTCGQFEFQCKNDGYCLPNYYVCDGYNDCTDDSDEMECDGNK